MKTLSIASLFALSFFWNACGSKVPAEDLQVNSIDSIRNLKPISNSALIENPISADTPNDPAQAAQIKFEEEAFDFGTLAEGDKVEHAFKFTNTGKNPLVISDAKGDCGCTVPEWPRTPIPPGESGVIKVSFNSSGKSGSQEKTVTLTANTTPNKVKLRITAEVELKEQK